MKENRIRSSVGAIAFLAAFIIWTLLIQFIDVQAVGPMGTEVGFATLNIGFHNLTGLHMELYTLTDWLELLSIFVCMCFGFLGLVQWIRRRSIAKVDVDILLLGAHYLIVIAGYILFEIFPINYRTVLIEGVLEASYPSSTTLLVLSVMPTLKFQVDHRVENKSVRDLTTVFVYVYSLFMLLGRMISGVHWFTDIVGAVFLSFGLFLLYASSVKLFLMKKTGKTKDDDCGIP